MSDALQEMYDYGTMTPPHCRDREESGCIRPRAHVTLVGLKSRGDLNGCGAVVGSAYSTAKDRWPVELDSGESILVKPENIRVAAR